MLALPLNQLEKTILPTRRNIIKLAAVTLAMSAVGARAADSTIIEFNDKAFHKAQAEGKSILLDVWASWCPTCKAQGPILKSLLGQPANKKIMMFRVNFDTQTEVLNELNVQSQSTLIVFKGLKEMGRSVGDTNPDSIAALLASAI